jgi:hypothetical protein
MNGYAPAELVNRREYIGLHGATGFDSDAWISAHPSVRKIIPSKVLEDEILERKLAGFFSDLEHVLYEIRRVLQPGGYAVIIIGDNTINGQRVASHSVLAALAMDAGFVKVSVKHRQIVSRRRRYPIGPFGFNGPMSHEFIVVLQKPPLNRTKTKSV